MILSHGEIINDGIGRPAAFSRFAVALITERTADRCETSGLACLEHLSVEIVGNCWSFGSFPERQVVRADVNNTKVQLKRTSACDGISPPGFEPCRHTRI